MHGKTSETLAIVQRKLTAIVEQATRYSRGTTAQMYLERDLEFIEGHATEAQDHLKWVEAEVGLVGGEIMRGGRPPEVRAYLTTGTRTPDGWPAVDPPGYTVEPGALRVVRPDGTVVVDWGGRDSGATRSYLRAVAWSDYDSLWDDIDRARKGLGLEGACG